MTAPSPDTRHGFSSKCAMTECEKCVACRVRFVEWPDLMCAECCEQARSWKCDFTPPSADGEDMRGNMNGHWLVTPRRGKNRTFKTTKAMVEFIRIHSGCLVTWIRPHS